METYLVKKMEMYLEELSATILFPGQSAGLEMADGPAQGQFQTYEPTPINYRELVRTSPALELILSLNPGVTWILDVRTGQYDFVSGNVKHLLGYAPQLFTIAGLAFAETLLHPADLPLFLKLLHQMQEVVQALPPRQRLYRMFTFDCRVLKATGEYVHMLMQTTVLQTDQQGNITHLLGTSSDISQWEKQGPLVPSARPANDKPSGGEAATGKHLPPPAGLSKREREVMKLVAEGYSSKQIADRLCISFHTVSTHRRNMIEKTGSKNTGELVHHALRCGAI